MIACFVIEAIGIGCEWLRLPNLYEHAFVVCEGGDIKAACPIAQSRGIRSGMVLTTGQALCKGLISLPYDAVTYTDAAEVIWDLIAEETNVVEPISPELCYADFDGVEIEARVRRLVASISEKVKVPVAVGIGESKMIARESAKSSIRGSILNGEQISDLLARFPVNQLPALDTKTLDRCKKLSLNTLGDIRKTPKRELALQFKQQAYRLGRLILGIDDDPVRPLWPKPSIEFTVRFEEEVNSIERIEQTIKEFSEKIAARLVANSLYCRSVRLIIVPENSDCISETEKLSNPIRETKALFRTGLRLLQRLKIDAPITELTLRADNLDAASGLQLKLLDTNEQGQGYPHERRQSLDATTRFLQKRVGPEAIMSAQLILKSQGETRWTFPMTKRRNEKVLVRLDNRGQPAFYHRYDRSGNELTFEVRSIINRWRETEWHWGKITNVDCYRVLSDNGGACELKCTGGEWRLNAVVD